MQPASCHSTIPRSPSRLRYLLFESPFQFRTPHSPLHIRIVRLSPASPQFSGAIRSFRFFLALASHRCHGAFALVFISVLVFIRGLNSTGPKMLPPLPLLPQCYRAPDRKKRQCSRGLLPMLPLLPQKPFLRRERKPPAASTRVPIVTM